MASVFPAPLIVVSFVFLFLPVPLLSASIVLGRGVRKRMGHKRSAKITSQRLNPRSASLHFQPSREGDEKGEEPRRRWGGLYTGVWVIAAVFRGGACSPRVATRHACVRWEWGREGGASRIEGHDRSVEEYIPSLHTLPRAYTCIYPLMLFWSSFACFVALWGSMQTVDAVDLDQEETVVLHSVVSGFLIGRSFFLLPEFGCHSTPGMRLRVPGFFAAA